MREDGAILALHADREEGQGEQAQRGREHEEREFLVEGTRGRRRELEVAADRRVDRRAGKREDREETAAVDHEEGHQVDDDDDKGHPRERPVANVARVRDARGRDIGRERGVVLRADEREDEIEDADLETNVEEESHVVPRGGIVGEHQRERRHACRDDRNHGHVIKGHVVVRDRDEARQARVEEHGKESLEHRHGTGDRRRRGRCGKRRGGRTGKRGHGSGRALGSRRVDGRVKSERGTRH